MLVDVRAHTKKALIISVWEKLPPVMSLVASSILYTNSSVFYKQRPITAPRVYSVPGGQYSSAHYSELTPSESLFTSEDEQLKVCKLYHGIYRSHVMQTQIYIIVII